MRFKLPVSVLTSIIHANLTLMMIEAAFVIVMHFVLQIVFVYHFEVIIRCNSILSHVYILHATVVIRWRDARYGDHVAKLAHYFIICQIVFTGYVDITVAFKRCIGPAGVAGVEWRALFGVYTIEAT